MVFFPNKQTSSNLTCIRVYREKKNYIYVSVKNEGGKKKNVLPRNNNCQRGQMKYYAATERWNRENLYFSSYMKKKQKKKRTTFTLSCLNSIKRRGRV